VIRVGDIYALAPIFATLYAIVSKAQTYSFEVPVEETKTEAPIPESFSKDMVNPYLDGPQYNQQRDSFAFTARDDDDRMDDEEKNS
jgi:hypothetical protein